MNKRFAGFVLAAAVLIFFSGCENSIFQPPGIIEFPDFTEQYKLMGSNVGLMNFDTKVVKLYDRNILPLKIKNSGKGPLVIRDIQLLQQKVPEANPVDAYDAFKFVEGTFPSLPLEIPAGSTVSDIFIEFDPETAGDFSAKIFIEAENADYYIDMTGVGLWELTVHGNADGKLYIMSDDGSVIEEIDGVADEGKATASDGVFNILCEASFLRQFETWGARLPTTSGDIELENEKSAKTVVTLKTHAGIDASILNPYVFVRTDYPDAVAEYTRNLASAIQYCDSQADKIAVVVAAGAHAVNSVDVRVDIPVYGGYKNDWTAPRLYKTAADRSNAAYRTVLNVTGTLNVSGSGIKDNVAIEGFVINKSGGGDAPLVKFDNGATAVLAYNDIISSGSGKAVAVEITNDAAPLVKYNYINGGNTSDDYSECYGIQITEGAAPVIYMNSISGGTANGDDSISFGIFCDFEAKPYIRNNTPLGGSPWGVSGGAAPGSGGQSYGIYIINNGNVLSEYNTVSGGSGGTAVAMYAGYGGYIKIRYNNIFTAGGSTRIALWAGQMGRIYVVEDSGLYDCPTALYKDPYSTKITSIEGINSRFGTDSNQNSAVDLSGAPEAGQYE